MAVTERTKGGDIFSETEERELPYEKFVTYSVHFHFLCKKSPQLVAAAIRQDLFPPPASPPGPVSEGSAPVVR